MGDLSSKEASGHTKIVGSDEQYAADVTLSDGVKRLETSSVVTIEQLFGRDPQGTTYFFIGTAEDSSGVGSAGDTVRVQIPAGAIPALWPAVDVTTTVTSGMVGATNSEVALADQIVTDLNNDANFSAAWEAIRIKDFSAVFINSKLFNEWGERTSWTLSSTGTTVVTQAFSDIVTRGFATELSRSPNDPRKGVLAIAGTVSVSGQTISNYSPQYLKNGSSLDMKVNGSGTPVEFKVDADADFDFIVTEVKILAQDGNINLSRFMDTTLTNGFLFEIVSDGESTTFPDLKTTRDVLQIFSSGGLYIEIIPNKAGQFIFKPDNPFVLKAGTSDKVSMTVRDDCTGLVALTSSIEGYLDMN